MNKSLAKILAMLSPSIILRALGIDIFLACVPNVAQTFNSSFAITQWVLTGYLIGSGLGQIIFGPLADKFGRRKVILSSIFLFLLSTIYCALVSCIQELIVARFIQGLTVCGSTVVTAAVIRDLFEDKKCAEAYSYLNAIIALAPILAPMIGGSILLATGTWRATFYFVAIIAALAFSINLFFLKETNPKAGQFSMKNYSHIILNKGFIGYIFCAISGLSGLFLFFAMSSILLISLLGVAPNKYGYFFAANFCIYLIANILSPRLQKNWPLNSVIHLGLVVVLVGSLFMLSLDYLYGLNIYTLLLPNSIITFGVGLIYGPCMAGAIRPFKHLAGTASAAYGATLYISTALLVAAVMQLPIRDAKPLAGIMLLLSSASLVSLSLLYRQNYKTLPDAYKLPSSL